MPIDVSSGNVHLEKSDFLVGGRFPLAWERNFQHGLTEESVSDLGPGWTNPYFAKLTRIGKEYRFRSGTGATIRFPDEQDSVEREGTVRNFASFHEISRRGAYLVVTRWTTSGKITKFLFLPAKYGDWWPLVSIENETGNGLELAWDDRARLKGVRQKHEKRTLILAYDGMARITSVSFRQGDGRLQGIAEYGYDKTGRLILARDALGYSERYEYDSSGKLMREIGKDGGIATFKYDDRARCIRFGGLEGYNLKTIRFLDHARMTEVTDSLGSTIRYQWLATGQVTTQLDAMGGKTETEFDEYGRVISKTSPMGAVTRFEYDKAGNRCKIVNALGKASVFEFNAAHLPIGFTDPSGRKWSREYDEGNKLIAYSGPSGDPWKIEYDPAGDPVRVIRPGGAIRRQKFGPSGVLEATTDWKGSVTRYQRDPFGRTLKRHDPDGAVHAFEYDALGRLTGISGPGGKSAKFTYDAGGNPTRVEKSGETPVEYIYGPCRRLLARKDGNGNSLRFKWGSEPERLESVQNELGQRYSFTYDAGGRVTHETGFDGETIAFKYDFDGRCIRKTMASGKTLSFKHDALGRIVEELAEGEAPAKFAYDAAGYLQSASNEWSELEFERDESGRVIGESQNGFKILRKFEPMGSMSELAAGENTVFKFEHDANGLTTAIEPNGLGKFTFDRNARGIAFGRGLPGGMRIDSNLDARNRLIKQTVSAQVAGSDSSKTILWRGYGYTESDLVESVTDSIWGESRYSYDADRRLVGFSIDGTGTEFKLNPAGDITSISGFSRADVEFGYAAGGRLERFGSSILGYDRDGRLVSRDDEREKPGWRFEWDAKDRLRFAFGPDGVRWEYQYDVLGRRTAKIGPTGKTRFIWDEDVLLKEIAPDGKEITWGFDPHSFRPIFKIQAGALYSILDDHLGTPREILDTGGKIVWSARFDPWGNIIAGKGDLEDCPFRFQGQYFDAETGFHYNRFRYYDPRVCRYISKDPARLRGGASSYQYVRNPMHWVDPFGLCGEDDKPAETVFRGERSSNDPDKVFENGLKSKGDNMDLQRHTTSNQPDTGYISTSQDIDIAEGFAGKNGYVYEIETNKGINANDTLGAASPFPEQKEVSVPKEIPPSDIKGAYPVKGGKMTGEFIPNPNFGGG